MRKSAKSENNVCRATPRQFRSREDASANKPRAAHYLMIASACETEMLNAP